MHGSAITYVIDGGFLLCRRKRCPTGLPAGTVPQGKRLRRSLTKDAATAPASADQVAPAASLQRISPASYGPANSEWRGITRTAMPRRPLWDSTARPVNQWAPSAVCARVRGRLGPTADQCAVEIHVSHEHLDRHIVGTQTRQGHAGCEWARPRPRQPGWGRPRAPPRRARGATAPPRDRANGRGRSPPRPGARAGSGRAGGRDRKMTRHNLGPFGSRCNS